MSVTCKRTLVKSPPELWSELSDPESLGRHLDGLGEIHIKRTEPETAVEWEADGARGSVRLEGTGFGTKVTLSLTREPVEPQAVAPVQPPAVEPEPQEPEAVAPEVTEPIEPESVVPIEPQAVEPEPALPVEFEPEVRPEPEPITGQMPALIAEPEPRLGFFARLFRRRRMAAPVPVERVEFEPAPESEHVCEAQPEQMLAPESEHGYEPETERILAPEPAPLAAEPAADVAAELAQVEAQMAAQDSRMLTAILDRLGAAHHRPFSRA